jgi:hypothetical protein
MVRYLTTNGDSDTFDGCWAFALKYRRADATFCEAINFGEIK